MELIRNKREKLPQLFKNLGRNKSKKIALATFAIFAIGVFAALPVVNAMSLICTMPPWPTISDWSGDVDWNLTSGKQWCRARTYGIGSWYSFTRFKKDFIADRTASIYMTWDYYVKYHLYACWGGGCDVRLYWIINVYDQYGNWQWGAPYASVKIYENYLDNFGPPVDLSFEDSKTDRYWNSDYRKVQSGWRVVIELEWYCAASVWLPWIFGEGMAYGDDGYPCYGRAYAQVSNIKVYYL